jgi:RHH-type transcriptional regulator, proline utilization regulon repressor / proline dehydrogenase / delta 1-pyrroline-5-carboxylate dehydrogenase
MNISDEGGFRPGPFEVLKHANEKDVLKSLLSDLHLSHKERDAIEERATQLVAQARESRNERGTLDTFLQEFGLSNKEGVALMCLAEALLRVPDADTRDQLIAEKIKSGNWRDHSGKSDSLLVNWSTWGLMLTGSVIKLDPGVTRNVGDFVKGLVSRSGEPVIRSAMIQAMRIMGDEFVLGRTIEEAMKRAAKSDEGLLHSFDMLGEGARTDADARRYQASYARAIEEIGARSKSLGIYDGPGISVKLSALHPRYEFAKSSTMMPLLLERTLSLAVLAAKADIGFTIDAEEANRLGLSLHVLESLARSPELEGWDGLGLAVQAYQKRADEVINWLVALGTDTGRRFMVRLVKGAYWDSEIKHAQKEGFEDYPVFTTKSATDVSYLACARKLIAAPKEIFPQFATHNAHTLAAILEMTDNATDFEFQRLHGMGDLLYKTARRHLEREFECRIYAPVGSHEDLLPYLVRRLLENGANSSFVHSFLNNDVPVATTIKDPLAAFEGQVHWRHPSIPLPKNLFGEARRNSCGLDLSDDARVNVLNERVASVAQASFRARPLVAPLKDDPGLQGKEIWVSNPSDSTNPAGTVIVAGQEDCLSSLARAKAAQPNWDKRGGAQRAEILNRVADLLEARTDRLIGLLSREAGKTLDDGVAEVREAVDFCRYYGGEAAESFEGPELLPGPTGETNELFLGGRGVFVCISPWNFPLAIFAGQVAAALAAGNAVLAKPAEQTPLIAYEVVKLFHEAGVPEDVLHLLPGGREVGAALVALPGIEGVAFTGSTATAKAINRALAAKEGPIATLIAETGGLNGMFVDSTALIEQVTDDVIRSAFGSAGQRCSALRILFLQDDIADKAIETIKGAMDELVIGKPAHLSTDVGPIIDIQARDGLQSHMDRMEIEAKILKQLSVPPECKGSFFGPALIEIDSLDLLKREVFGPILHVMRFDANKVSDVIKALREKNYGLTLGVHSRLRSFADQVMEEMPAGNTYINRDIIGAVVGVQPFGGCGLSGTGPKAGGPHYLSRFASERVRTDNITAQGGNAALFCLDPEPVSEGQSE